MPTSSSTDFVEMRVTVIVVRRGLKTHRKILSSKGHGKEAFRSTVVCVSVELSSGTVLKRSHFTVPSHGQPSPRGDPQAVQGRVIC